MEMLSGEGDRRRSHTLSQESQSVVVISSQISLS